MTLDSINCPKCGAPLSLQPHQRLVVCGYCNSSVRVSLQAKDQPLVRQAEDIPTAVVDEVKRLLVLGLQTQATDYYESKAHVSPQEAKVAVAALNAEIGYVPPLNRQGFLMLIGLALVSVAGVVGAGALWQAGWAVPGVGLLIAAGVFAYMNWFALRRSLAATWLMWRGAAGQATILKSWRIRVIPLAGQGQSAELLRLLLAVRPSDGAMFQTEANCLVGPQSLPNFQVGSVVEVKYDSKHQKKVVVTGAATG